MNVIDDALVKTKSFSTLCPYLFAGWRIRHELRRRLQSEVVALWHDFGYNYFDFSNLFHIIKEYARWPNAYFAPKDSIFYLFLEYEASFTGLEILLALEKEIGKEIALANQNNTMLALIEQSNIKKMIFLNRQGGS